jgi:SAM-dependent methyltransferase
LIQTIVTPAWQSECDEIYRGYTIYHQSQGVEQPVFDNASGVGHARSGAIMAALKDRVALPAAGRWLDIGCGNGAMLRACSRALPGWALCGSEVSNKYKSAIESIPGVERLFTCPIAEIPGSFDVISLIHVIEHIPGPRSFLQQISAKLKPNGLLLLEAPDCRQNFFMLMVADHCSHFSAGMLADVASGAGYEVLHAADTWLPKEITVVGRKPAAPRSACDGLSSKEESKQVFSGWDTLRRIVDQIESLKKAGHFGIFGTSIAATWLDTQTGNAAGFFVDEDLNRVGKQHMGRPILPVADIPDDASVFLALPPVVAERVLKRLRSARPAGHFLAP